MFGLDFLLEKEEEKQATFLHPTTTDHEPATFEHDTPKRKQSLPRHVSEWTDESGIPEVRWSESVHESLETAFLRDAPRTKLMLDGKCVTDYSQAFWTILRKCGWGAGSRIAYMCTGNALGASFDRAQAALEGGPDLVLVQCKDSLYTSVDTETKSATLQKSFHVIRLEPFSIESKWYLVKTYCSNTNKSIDKWTRDDTLFASKKESVDSTRTIITPPSSQPVPAEKASSVPTIHVRHTDESDDERQQQQQQRDTIKDTPSGHTSFDEASSTYTISDDESIQSEDALEIMIGSKSNSENSPVLQKAKKQSAKRLLRRQAASHSFNNRYKHGKNKNIVSIDCTLPYTSDEEVDGDDEDCTDDVTDPDTDACDSHSERGYSPMNTPTRGGDKGGRVSPATSTSRVRRGTPDPIWQLDMSLLPDYSEVTQKAQVEQRPMRTRSSSESFLDALFHL